MVSWNKTKKIYIKWLQNNKLKKLLCENFLYSNNLSLWWLTTLVDKDNINNKTWYTNLNLKLSNQNIKLEQYNFIFFLFKIFKSFLNKILCLIIFSLFLRDKTKKKNYRNGLYVTQSNLINFNNYTIDKQYGKFSHQSISDNCYLIDLDENFNNLINIFKIKKKLGRILNDYLILNTSVKLYEIIKIYVFVFFQFLKIRRLLKKKNYFYINKKNCKNILEDYFILSFFGPIQNQILKGKRLKEKITNINFKNFLTYLEFFPFSRSLYYFIKKSKVKNIVSINHGNTSDNDLFFCLSKKDFSNNNDFINFSPKPDYFTTKGQIYYKKLSKIFDRKKIFKTGSFKIELDKSFTSSKNLRKSRFKKLFLICGLNDYEPFVYMLNHIKPIKYNIILIPHPVVKLQTIRFFSKNSNFNFVIKKLSKKKNFFKKDDLIIFGDSSVGLELAYRNYNIIRVYNEKYQPTFDFTKDIHTSTTIKDLKLFLKGKKTKVDPKIIEKNYFFKFDKKASIRLEKILKNI